MFCSGHVFVHLGNGRFMHARLALATTFTSFVGLYLMFGCVATYMFDSIETWCAIYFIGVDCVACVAYIRLQLGGYLCIAHAFRHKWPLICCRVLCMACWRLWFARAISPMLFTSLLHVALNCLRIIEAHSYSYMSCFLVSVRNVDSAIASLAASLVSSLHMRGSFPVQTQLFSYSCFHFRWRTLPSGLSALLR